MLSTITIENQSATYSSAIERIIILNYNSLRIIHETKGRKEKAGEFPHPPFSSFNISKGKDIVL